MRGTGQTASKAMHISFVQDVKSMNKGYGKKCVKIYHCLEFISLFDDDSVSIALHVRWILWLFFELRG